MHSAARLSKAILPLCVRNNASPLSTTASSSPTSRIAVQPNPRLDLDPSLQTLLQDVDMSLHSFTKMENRTPHELEILSTQGGVAEATPNDLHQDTYDNLPRKSPAAQFGSLRIGSVVLPLELQNKIQRLISDANKSQLHSDVKRLFQRDDTSASEWDLQYGAKYRTRLQAMKHAKRDGTAFASVALPAHYSAIYAVLDHVRRRLGSAWRVERVLDWGAGTGSGLWASLYSFQSDSPAETEMVDFRIAGSVINSYVGIEKRSGLTEIGRLLLQGLQPKHLSINWQKGWRTEDNVDPAYGEGVVALSAFLLTTLPDALSRKQLVREMWESGAKTMILLDHSSKEGFEAIAAAREYLLDLGHRSGAGETSTLAGSHVVAPCPHDGRCPLYHPGAIKLVCGYSQRIQRPEFVRHAKNSGVGHEDIGYSYVVVQRGPRPGPTITGLGRVGAVGQRAFDRASSKYLVQELQIHGEQVLNVESSHQAPEHNKLPPAVADEGLTSSETHEAIRLEAYNWPRLVFPPLKRSGHIILDGCTAEGKIMRMTIPKSQGKQPFYDARKSSWGDIFPHPPKNKPQERQHVLKPGSSNIAGSDIGKRGWDQDRERISYEQIAKELLDQRKKSQRDWRTMRGSVRDDDDDDD